MRRDRLTYILLLLPLIVFLIVMVLIPFLIAVLSSVGLTQIAPGIPDRFTLQGYIDFFNPSKPNLVCLWFTIKVTLIGTILSTGIGYFLALFFKFRTKI